MQTSPIKTKIELQGKYCNKFILQQQYSRSCVNKNALLYDNVR